jgi:hypothetical protein
VEPAHRAGRAPLSHHPDHAARHAQLLMQITDWLRTACADADARGLPELKPLLETLARATARLRDADEAHRRGPTRREDRP